MGEHDLEDLILRWARTAGIGFFLLDRQGRIVECNQAAARILERQRSELLDRALADFIHPEDLTDVERRVAELRAGSTVFVERRLRRAGGGYHYCELGVIDLGEQGVGLACRAVESRRRLEARLRVADRLASAGVMLESITHSLNDPLSILLLNSRDMIEQVSKLQARLSRAWMKVANSLGQERAREIFSSSGPDEENRRTDRLHAQLEEIWQASERLIRISRSIQEFVSQQQPADAAEVNTVVERALALMEEELRFRARVRRELGQVPRARVTSSQLAHAVVNLLQNAALAIDKRGCGHGEIVVRTFREGESVCLAVRDNGAGMDADEQKMIFEPDYSSWSDATTAGLGLFVVRQVVDDAGGHIRIESTVGQGSEFTLVLPVAEGTEAPPTEEHRNFNRRCGQATPRVLVVDDDAGMGRAIRRILEPHCRIVFVDSGEKAIAQLEHDSNFDLVLCDVVMPGLNGFDLHDWIMKNNPRLARCFLFMTGGVFTAAAKERLRRKAVMLIEKPFSPTGLRETIFDLLGREE